VIALLLSTLCLTLTLQNVTSNPQDIKILSYSHYVDALEILEIVGEIQNIGTSTIERALLTVAVYSTDGLNQGNVTGYAWLSNMAPQQKSPFRLEIKEPADYDDWHSAGVSKIEISVREAKETSSHFYSDLEISVSSAGVSTSGDDKGTYWVNGVVRNVGSQTASKLAVAAVYYNSSGVVVAIGRTNYLIPENVSPSGVALFNVGAFDTDQLSESGNRKIASYALFVQAELPLIEGGAAPTITTPVTGTASITQNPSASSDRNSIYLLIIFAVVFAVIIALLASRRKIATKTETINQKKPTNKNR
jgi:hypothetical protein